MPRILRRIGLWLHVVAIGAIHFLAADHCSVHLVESLRATYNRVGGIVDSIMVHHLLSVMLVDDWQELSLRIHVYHRAPVSIDNHQ